MVTKTLNPADELPEYIPGIMKMLRDIRDQNSLRHMRMTPKERLAEERRHRKEYAIWPEGTVFANGTREY